MATAELENDSSGESDERQLVAGRYRLHDRIGSGRLGEIFEATAVEDVDADGGRRLAVQIVPQTIVRNNRLFNQLNVGYSRLRAAAHPNLVGYLRFGRHSKGGYLAMELLDGISLRQTLDEVHTLPIEEAKPIVRGVGEALQMLHSEDMVHGNLTCSNVFVTLGMGVRLLDVLPVNPSEMMVRGRDANDPFTRSTVQDDVFALACLTYEMLAGRHPFDNRAPQDAKSERLEPDAITSIADAEWKALRRALSFDRDQRTSSVADFLRELGIRGTERLPPPSRPPTADASVVQSPPEARPPIEPEAEPAAASSPATAYSTVAAAPRATRSDSRAASVRKRQHTGRAVILGLLLAGLGVWYYFGQPRERFVELLGFLDTNTRLELVRPSVTVAPDAPTAPDPVTSIDRNTPAGAEVDGAVETGTATTMRDNQTPAGVDARTAEATLTGVDEPDGAAPATEETSDTPSAEREGGNIVEPPATSEEPSAEAASSVAASKDTSVTAGGGESAEEVSAAASTTTEARPSEPIVSFDASVVQVFERDGVIRISAPVVSPSGKPVVWWTSDGSARSGLDFIGVEPQYVGGAPAETVTNILIVPLVNDSLPEAREAFDVNFGIYDSARVDIDRIATLRVEVVDDDGP